MAAAVGGAGGPSALTSSHGGAGAPGAAVGPPPHTPSHGGSHSGAQQSIGSQLVAVIGIKPNVCGPIAYLEDGEIQYVAGRNIIRFDTESRAQRILQGSPHLSGITAVATSPNRKLSAYAECGPDAQPVIIVYEWAARRRKRVITGLDSGTAPVTHLAFTADGRHLVVQTAAPEWVMHYIALDRANTAKVLASYRGVAPSNKAISLVDCHPSDPSLIAVSGRGFFKLMRFADDSLKPVQVNLRRDPTHFTCHVWLPDERIVLGAMNGELWLLDSGEFKRMLADGGAAALASTGADTTLTPAISASKPVGSLMAFPKGFLVGCEGGILKVFDNQRPEGEGKASYKHVRTFVLGGDDMSRIVGMGISPNEDDVAIVTAAGQVYGFKLSAYELFKPGDAVFRHLISPFHTLPAYTAQTSGAASGGGGGGGGGAGMYGDSDFHDSAGGMGGSHGHGHGPSHGAPRRGSVTGSLPSTASALDAGRGGAASSGPAASSAAAAASLLDPLSQPNHGITGLDVCIRKSLFITCGADRTVRVWNYAPNMAGDVGMSMSMMTGGGGRYGGGGAGAGGRSAEGGDGGGTGITATPSLELSQRFAETPLCVSLHPSGFHALVGFETSLQLLNVLLDSLRPFKDFPIRSCTEARFSHNGAMFAAANGNAISVFSTYTCAPVVSLRSHADRVVCFAWSRDDRNIVSVSRDGTIIRHAVVVANAVAGTGSVPPSAGGVGLGGLSGPPSSAGGGERGAAVAGRALNILEIKDLTPLSITTTGADNGREVIVSGIIGRHGVGRPILRHLDVGQALKDAIKFEAPLGSQVVRSLAALPGPRLLAAAMGSSIERFRGLGAGGGSGGFMGLAASSSDVGGSGSVAFAGKPRSGSVAFASNASERGDGAMSLASPSVSVQGSAILPSTDRSADPRAHAAAAGAGGHGSASGGRDHTPLADAAGCLRGYRLPPGPDYYDCVAHAGPVIRVAALPNGRAVVTVGADGSIAIIAIADLRPKTAAGGSSGAAGGAGAGSGMGAGGGGGGEGDGLPFADEILVTRADLEEVRREKADLEKRVQVRLMLK